MQVSMADRDSTLRTAVLVSTRNRRDEISAWLFAMRGTSADWIIVVDNNDTGDRDWILSGAESAGLDVIYAHCTKTGYASPRNAGIKIAVEKDADVVILLDDDDVPPSDIVDKHLKAMALYRADVVTGYSSHDRPEGQQLASASTRNVSLKRWILDKGIRFDERLNLTGSEDVEFFRDARKLGARIVFSNLPKLTLAVQPQRPQSKEAVSLYGPAKAQNRLYVERVRRGLWPALRMYLTKYALRLPAGLTLFALGKVFFVAGLAATGRGLILSHGHAWRGLQGRGLNRLALKAGRLEEVSLDR